MCTAVSGHDLFDSAFSSLLNDSNNAFIDGFVKSGNPPVIGFELCGEAS
jgi:hypothetical protein